jgi:hypothetical protein
MWRAADVRGADVFGLPDDNGRRVHAASGRAEGFTRVKASPAVE